MTAWTLAEVYLGRPARPTVHMLVDEQEGRELIYKLRERRAADLQADPTSAARDTVHALLPPEAL